MPNINQRMNSFWKLLLAACLFSCHTQTKTSAALVQYKDWKIMASKTFAKELATVCSHWPKEWNDCPKGDLEWETIDSIDIGNDIKILDSLKQAYNIDGTKACKLSVIHQFNHGFNDWYSEKFLIKIGNKWKGKEIYRAAPPGDLKDLMDEIPDEEEIELTREEINCFLKLKSGTLAYNGDIKIITFLNEQYEITGFHMVLYP